MGGKTTSTLEELGIVDGQIEQARRLLSDAITKLSRCFTTLTSETTGQRDSLKGLLANLNTAETSHVSVQSVARETADVLRHFSNLLASISAQSVKVVSRIDAMALEMDDIFKFVDQIDEIAQDTSILAVNATIEAAHAGAAGASFQVVANSIRELSKRTKVFNRQIGDQVGKARTTVKEVRTSIAEMSGREMDVALSGKDRIESMMAGLSELQKSVTSTLDQADGAARRVEAATAQAITALQVEDILNQLLVAAQAHLHRAAELTELPSGEEFGGAEVSDPVQQTDVAPGSVELF